MGIERGIEREERQKQRQTQTELETGTHTRQGGREGAHATETDRQVVNKLLVCNAHPTSTVISRRRQTGMTKTEEGGRERG